MLAALVVLGAAALTLAPTGSDGTTSQSPSSEAVDTLERGLEPIFVERTDVFTDEVVTPTSDRDRPPIDPDTARSLLARAPLTDRQIAETVELLLSLGDQETPAGSIASLEPRPDQTRTATLLRLGNEAEYDFGGQDSTLLEGAAAISDVAIVLESDTLPFEEEGRFSFSVGEWSIEAFQDHRSDMIEYRIDGYDAGRWQQTHDDRLLLDFAADEINGEPVGPGETLTIDPGDGPFDIAVSDEQWPEGIARGTHGGLSAVVTDGTPVDLDPGDVKTVVTEAAFEATYLDHETTYTEHLTIPATYTAYDFVTSNASRPGESTFDLAVETETPSDLDTVPEGSDVWLPRYSGEPELRYELTVTETVAGVTYDRTDDAVFTFYENGDECDSDCVALETTPGEQRTFAIPQVLTEDLEIQASLSEENTTLAETVAVREPYVETALNVEPAEVLLDTTLDSVTLALDPRKDGISTQHVSRAELTDLDANAVLQGVTGLAESFDLTTEAEQHLIALALVRISEYEGDMDELRQADPMTKASLLGFEGEEQTTVANFFATVGTVSIDLETIMTGGSETGAAAGIFVDALDTATLASLAQLGTRFDNLDAGDELPAAQLYDMSPENEALIIEMLGFDDTDDRETSAQIVFEYLTMYTGDPDDLLELADGDLQEDHNEVFGQAFEDGWAVPTLGDFHDIADELFDRMAAFPESDDPVDDFSADDFHTLSDTERHQFLWFLGITDVEDRDDYLDLAAEFDDGMDVSWSELDTAAQYELLDHTDFVENSQVTAPDREGLIADWDILVRGEYDEYDFATYNDTEALTVVDIGFGLEGEVTIDVDIDHPSVVESYYTDYRLSRLAGVHDTPLVLGEAADIETTVIHPDGSSETNPGYVEFELVGPYFDPENAVGPHPEEPEDFATIDQQAQTITAEHETGVHYGEETGPIELEASIPDTDASDVTEERAVDIGIEGFVNIDGRGDSALIAVPGELGESMFLSTDLWVQYVTTHGDAEDTNSVEIGSDDYDEYDLDAGQTIAEYHRNDMEIEVHQTMNDYRDIFFYDMEEEAALDLDIVDQEYVDADGEFWVYDNSVEDPEVELDGHIFMATNQTSGVPRAEDSTYRSEEGGVTASPTDDQDRWHQSVEETIRDGDTQQFWVYNNFEAVVAQHFNQEALANGTVHWRSTTVCDGSPENPDEPQCLWDPMGIVDHVDTGPSDWDTEITTGTSDSDRMTMWVVNANEGDPIFDYTITAELEDDVDEAVPGTVFVDAWASDVESNWDDDDSTYVEAAERSQISIIVEPVEEGGPS